jgi:hypothetical protein
MYKDLSMKLAPSKNPRPYPKYNLKSKMGWEYGTRDRASA